MTHGPLNIGDISGGSQVLWEDGDRVFSRGWRSDSHGNRHPVLIVAPATDHPSRSTLDRLVHEYDLRDELDGTWAVRPLALLHDANRIMLVLEDASGEPLDQMLDGPMAIGPFLELAIAIAAALGTVHQRGLVHKDIKPNNILVNQATGEVRLTGFGIASRLARERQLPHPPATVAAGTLAYMAPEQTGRINRSIDSRSDLYALGITLYQMLTGSLPFTAADPVEWMHCHIARQATPPRGRMTAVPAVVSAIVMKLLAKTAEQRYQTATGLERDLRRCLAGFQSSIGIEDFALGERDTPDWLLTPEQLYGRRGEIETLLASFDRVVNGGAPELILVSGYSGIGKSAVVNELQPALVPPRALFAAGKFDQYKRDIPHSTLAQAFESLIRSLLTKKDVELDTWRDAFNDALDPNGQLMVDMVPDLKLIIGEQMPVSELPHQDAQRRFQRVFRRFLSVFATSEHPLALFLDDLQWLDAATLDLLEHVLTHPDGGHVLFIGAYRDNEVPPNHPLVRTLDAVRSAGVPVHEIVLAPLAEDSVGQLVADSLHCDPAHAAPLANLIYEKTAGNPFFVIQFLSALVREGLLTFDHRGEHWCWDLSRIHAKGYSDNVVDLMVGSLSRLPDNARDALLQLACFGNSAPSPLLAMACDLSKEGLHRELTEALRSGLVVSSGDSYRFVHDRVREAAYSLLPEAQRAAMHLRIGRLLEAYTSVEERPDTIFEVASQFNRGAPLIQSRAEREQLAELNLAAGRRAKASAAYMAALHYFVKGTELFSDDGWDRRADLLFPLELQRAECEFLTGELAAAEARLQMLAARAATRVESAAVTCLLVDVYTARDWTDGAVDVCLDYLRHNGIEWSPHPTAEAARYEYDRLWTLLGGRDIEDLVDLPLMNDSDVQATLEVLSKALTPAAYTDANLNALILWRMINLSIEHGNADASCHAYAYAAKFAGSRFNDYQAGLRFSRLGFELVERRGLKKFKALAYLAYAVGGASWTTHLRVARDLIRQAFETATISGDFTNAVFSLHHLIPNLLAAGDPLVEVQREVDRALAFVQPARSGLETDIFATQLALIHTLRGLTPTFGCLSGTQFDELQIERRLSGEPRLAFAACRYWTRKLQARFFAGDYAAAVDASLNAQRLLWISPSSFELAEAHFYGALSHAAAIDGVASFQDQEHVEALTVHHRQLVQWAGTCPETFHNRATVVGAEVARIEGRELDAERLYEEAIRSARQNGFVQNEALANELAARFYSARGFETISQAYLRNARYCYLRWDADGKVRQLEAQYPYLGVEHASSDPTRTVLTPVEQLDLSTVVKLSQAVRSETDLEKLIAVIMRLGLEHAGAERGLLILPHGDAYRIEAEARSSNESVSVDLRHTSVGVDDLPQSVLQYVLRARERVLVQDAAGISEFSDDEYLRRHRARSVLCMPLLKQTKLTGIIYLENSLTSGAFTAARMALLEVLASDAAISLENARLYRDLQEREARVRRLIDANIIGISIWHADGRILDANEEFLRIVGYDREDLVLRRVRWTDLTPPEERDAVLRTLGQVTAGGNQKAEERELVRKDGSRVPVLAGGTTFEGVTEEGVGFLVDVTERKRAELALRESEREARLIVETIPGLVASLSPAGEVEFVNNGLIEYCGQELEAMKQWGTNGTVHVDDLPHVVDLFTRGITSGEPYDFDARIRRHDGIYRWFQVRGLPLRDVSGQIVRWYSLLVDIDDRKRAEAELSALKDQLYKENLVLRDEVDRTSMFEEIVGTSTALQPVLARVAKVARSDSTVLITGETGTGKELVARAIHRRSARASRAFVSVNCAAIPRELIASELFGHEKGAFTGATQRRLGRFELAHGGTIFLDEVGDLPMETQVALLRVLQERVFERVGGTSSVHVDVRIVAATNRDLQTLIEAGTFRSDLFYRLNVVPIAMPALRERTDDIPLLVEYFIDRYARKAGKTIRRVNKRTLDHLRSYAWPGNVRELQNVIERSVIVCDTDEFRIDESWLSSAPRAKDSRVLSNTLASHERTIIEDALRASGGRVFGPSGAAARLGIARSTLESKIRSLGIDKNRFRPRRTQQ